MVTETYCTLSSFVMLLPEAAVKELLTKRRVWRNMEGMRVKLHKRVDAVR
jgi:hypothetical protein